VALVPPVARCTIVTTNGNRGVITLGRRTLTATEFTFHQKYVKDGASFSPADLEGEDLLELFEAWAAQLSVADTKDDTRQSWIEVTRVQKYASRVVVVSMSVGSYGEAGPVIDADSGSKVFDLTEMQAPTGQVRGVLMVPVVGESAYYLAEQSSRGSAGGRLLGLFRKHFSQHSNSITLVTETITESEAWTQDAALREVELRLKGVSADIADGPNVEVGTLSHIARPTRGKFFPRGLLSKLGEDHQVVRKVVGIPEAPDEGEVFVTLELDGRQKKFMLGNGGAPALRQVLNEGAAPALSDGDLVAVCVERVSDLAARTGSSWISGWSTP